MTARPSLRSALGALPVGASMALVGVAATSVGVALAQERAAAEAANPALTFGVQFGLAADDEETELRTGLSLAFQTSTRVQSLSFALDADAQLGEDGLDRDAFSPQLGLDYRFDNGVSLLTFEADYARQEVDGLVFVLADGALDDGTLDPGDIGSVEDDGTLETRRFALGLELFRTAPIGLELGAALRQRDYRDTSDPDLEDSERLTLDAGLRLTVRPDLTFRLTTSRTEETEDGLLDSDTTIESYGARVLWQATPTISADIGLQDTRREESRNVVTPAGDLTGGRETITNSGLTFDASFVQDRPNGQRRLTLGRRLTDEKSIYDLSLGRALELPGGSNLDASIGLSAFEGGETTVVGSLLWQTELRPDAPFRATLTRRATTDSEDQGIARTDLRLSYGVPLSPVSRANLALGLSHVDVLEGFEPDSTGGSLTLGYDRELSPDWSISASYTHAASREDGGDTERDNRFSLTLGRSFEFGL